MAKRKSRYIQKKQKTNRTDSNHSDDGLLDRWAKEYPNLIPALIIAFIGIIVILAFAIMYSGLLSKFIKTDQSSKDSHKNDNKPDTCNEEIGCSIPPATLPKESSITKLPTFFKKMPSDSPALSLLEESSTSDSLTQKQDNSAIDEILGKISIFNAVVNSSDSSGKNIIRSKIDSKNPIRQMIGKALLSVSSNYHREKVLPELGICIFDENSEMAGIYDQAFFRADMQIMHDNTIKYIRNIYLSRYLFDTESCRAAQLQVTIANELSHATNAYRKLSDKGSRDTLLVPWRNKKQKNTFLEAHSKFLERVNIYSALAQRQERGQQLSQAEEVQLQKYDNTLSKFVPWFQNKECHTMLQSHYRYNSDDQLEHYYNPDHVIPERGAPEYTNYIRGTFFTAINHQFIVHQYQGHTKGVTAGEKLSDFEELPPEMRKRFGPELCDYLDDFHGQEVMCEAPNWDVPSFV